MATRPATAARAPEAPQVEAPAVTIAVGLEEVVLQRLSVKSLLKIATIQRRGVYLRSVAGAASDTGGRRASGGSTGNGDGLVNDGGNDSGDRGGDGVDGVAGAAASTSANSGRVDGRDGGVAVAGRTAGSGNRDSRANSGLRRASCGRSGLANGRVGGGGALRWDGSSGRGGGAHKGGGKGDERGRGHGAAGRAVGHGGGTRSNSLVVGAVDGALSESVDGGGGTINSRQ